MNKSIKITFGVLAGTLILITGFGISKANDYKNRNKELTVQIEKINHERMELTRKKEEYTVSTVQENYAKNKVNLKSSLPQLNQKLTDAFQQTYSKTKNQDDYNALQESLPKIVGNDLSKKLIEISKPSLSQSGEKTTPFGNLDQLNIDYGKYDIDSNKIPLSVTVNYSSSKIFSGGSGNIPDEYKDKYTVNKSADVFTLTYDFSSKKFTLLDCQRAKLVPQNSKKDEPKG